MESISSSEEPGKKRDSAQVEYGSEEKSKKVRVQNDHSGRKATPSSHSENHNTDDKEDGRSSSSTAGRSISTTRKSSENNKHSCGLPRIWDLESALLYLTQQVEADEKELLSNKRNAPWVTFRVGHAGDASTIANWYRQSTLMDSPEPELEVKTPQQANSDDDSQDETSASSMLEVWLADGLGDEDNPPAVHALIAQVHEEQDGEKAMTSIGAVALFTLTWEDGERVLRIPWIHFDTHLPNHVLGHLERRTWLRISTLSQMVSCQAIRVDKDLTGASVANDKQNESPSPCAE